MNIMGGGWGGRPERDGESAAVSNCQGDVRNAPIEVQETNYPFIIECHRLRADSGGAGTRRGGLGLEIQYRCLQACLVNINLERSLDPPWGLDGGLPGAVNMAIIYRVDGSEQVVYKGTNIRLETGDRVSFLTAGGGGYGDPAHRSADAVAGDLVQGLITPTAAERDYGRPLGEDSKQ
jgi:N-methylhydantoinase B